MSLTASKTGSSDTETKIDYITAVALPSSVTINNFRTTYYGQITTEPNYQDFETNYYYLAQ